MFSSRQVYIFLLRTLLICLTVFCARDSNAVPGTRLLNPTAFSVVGNNHSTFPLISWDGSTIAFESLANNLIPLALTNKSIQIYASHPGSIQVSLVSSGALNIPSDKDSFLEDISRNGDVVLFQSASTNLTIPPLTLASTNLFVRVLSRNQTILVSAQPGGVAPKGISSNGLLSPDGRSVYFESTSSNLASTPLPSSANYLYLRNIQDSSTITVGTNFLGSTNSATLFVRGNLSTTGQYASYGVVSNDIASVVVQDVSLQSSRVVWSTNSTNVVISNVQLSDDGHRLLFSVSDISVPNSTCFFSDLMTNSIASLGFTSFVVSSGEKLGPQLSPDGRYVLFAPFQYTSNRVFTIWDQAVGTNVLTITGTSGNFSADGNLITFLGYCQDYGFSGSRTNNQLFQIDLTAGSINILSSNTNGTPASLDISGLSVSRDGRIMAFQTPDSDIYPGDFNGAMDVFSLSTANPSYQLVSRTASPQLLPLLKPDVEVIGTVTISNKMWAVLNEKLQTFSPTETNTAFQLLLLEPESQTRILVTTNTFGKPFFGKIMSPVFSQDGAIFAFNTDSRDLLPTNPNKLRTNLFIFNRRNGSFTNLSSDFDYTIYPLSAPSLTRDGSILAFTREDSQTYNSRSNFLFFTESGLSERFSNATDIPPLISPDGSSILYCTGSPLALWLTNRILHSSASFGNVQPTNAFFSANSKCVFFGQTNVTSIDTSTFQTNFLNDGKPLAVSSNGMILVFTKYAPRQQIFTWDLANMSISRISQIFTSYTAPTVRQASISPDGRYILFRIDSAFIPGVDVNNLQSRVCLVDRLTKTVDLILGSDGEQNSIGSAPMFGKDGSYILYRSYNFEPQGFASQTSATFYFSFGNSGFIDSDLDGLDDNWEVRVYGNLNHAGQEDSDGDGLTDLQEFIAGTDPLDAGSRLNFNPSDYGNLVWKRNLGKNCRIQYKNSLSDPNWLDLDVPIGVNGNKAQAIDNTSYGVKTRFYRLVLVP